MPELTCLTGTVHLLQILLRDLCKALQPQQSNSRQGSKLKAFHHPHMQQGGTLCFVKNFACHTTAISPSGEPESCCRPSGHLLVICSITSTSSTCFHHLQPLLSSSFLCREHLDPRDRVLFDILDQGGTVRFRCGCTVQKAEVLSEADASTC